ncbi:hypothetical protein Tco_1419396 [Tanacetum coccineum]
MIRTISCKRNMWSIHDYLCTFHKLINDMKITQLNIPTHQMNTKFVNNLPPYWAKYVTNVKNNKDISATTYVELYTYLKSYEPHAMKTLKKQEQSTSTVDPLAYLAQTTHYHAPTQITNPPPAQYGPLTSSTPQQGRARNVWYTGNRGTRTTADEGQTLREEGDMLQLPWEKGMYLGSSNSLRFEAVSILADVECTAPYDQPLAITTTNMFEVSHEDAYDSDVDEGPHADISFMANMSSMNETNVNHQSSQ